MDVQQMGEPDQRQFFPYPLTQQFQPLVVPPVKTCRTEKPTVLPSPQHPLHTETSVKIEPVKMSAETLIFDKVLHQDNNKFKHLLLK